MNATSHMHWDEIRCFFFPSSCDCAFHRHVPLPLLPPRTPSPTFLPSSSIVAAFIIFCVIIFCIRRARLRAASGQTSATVVVVQEQQPVPQEVYVSQVVASPAPGQEAYYPPAQPQQQYVVQQQYGEPQPYAQPQPAYGQPAYAYGQPQQVPTSNHVQY